MSLGFVYKEISGMNQFGSEFKAQIVLPVCQNK